MNRANYNSLPFIVLVALISAVAIVAIALNRPIKIEGDPSGKIKIETTAGSVSPQRRNIEYFGD